MVNKFKKTSQNLPIEEAIGNIITDSDNTSDESDDNNNIRRTQANTTQSSNRKRKKPADEQKPLLAFIEYVNKEAEDKVATNSSRTWICKFCHQRCKSSYTRIHRHFFGYTGKKSDVKRCAVMSSNIAEFNKVKKIVEEAEKLGVSTTLKSSVIVKNPRKNSSNPLEESFGLMQRDAVDQAIMRFLCANGIAFNVLRSPQFVEMVNALRRAPAGYKPPSYERARTTLFDECKRNVEKELTPIKDTWGTQGVSIISDGWSNVKNEPLINVIAENNRGAMFMNTTDFSGVVKTGPEIADFFC